VLQVFACVVSAELMLHKSANRMRRLPSTGELTTDFQPSARQWYEIIVLLHEREALVQIPHVPRTTTLYVASRVTVTFLLSHFSNI
jgi:hypothetical protein